MKIRIKKIIKALGDSFLFIVRHDFLAYLFLFLLSLIFGALLIYKYSILAQKTELGDLDQSFRIKERKYQGVLRIWQEHEKIFMEADFKEHSDPFKRELTE